MKFRSLIAATGIVATALFATAAGAADSDYFKGKRISFVLGFGAGGGYDAYARMLAPYYEKELGAEVVVVNQPGAGGMSALNRMYNVPSDQPRMTIINGTGAALQQIVGLKGLKFDLRKFPNLGIVHSSRWIWIVKNDSPFKTVKDAMNSPNVINWAGYGKISGISDGAAMTCHMLGLKCNIVAGYKGSRAAALAVAQGEMDALYVSETSADKFVKAKNGRALATVNTERSTLFPDTPSLVEAVPNLNDEQKWMLNWRNNLESLGRIIAAAPDTPPEAVEVLRAATDKILKDPAVIAEANKRKRFITYIPAAEAEQLIDNVLNSATDEQKAKIKEVVLGS